MNPPRRRIISSPPAKDWSKAGRLWKCLKCGKLFPRAGQGHSCCVFSLAHHFGARPRAGELFKALREAIEDVGRGVRLSIAKTRIGFITNITFAAVTPRKTHLRVHILLPRKIDSPRFLRVEKGPPYWVHHFEIHDESDIDDALRGWLREACAVGARRR